MSSKISRAIGPRSKGLWSETFLKAEQWQPIRDALDRPILESWNQLSERTKRSIVTRCAQRILEEESTATTKAAIDPILRAVKTGKAFEAPVGPEDIPSQIPKPNPISEDYIPIEKADPGIPGEIIVDQNGKLLKRYLNFTGFTKFLIDSYDHWITYELPPLIESTVVAVQGGKIKFEKLSLKATKIAGKIVYPRQARLDGLTYGLDLHAYVVLEKELPDGEIQREFLGGDNNKKYLGTIPLMLRSKKCYLHNMSPRELQAVNEDPSDPFGYFIVSGVEKVVLIQEKLRLNRIFVTQSKKKTEASLTVETLHGTVRVNFVVGKQKRINFETRFKAETQTRAKKKKRKEIEKELEEGPSALKEAPRIPSVSKKDGNYRSIGVEKLFYILQNRIDPYHKPNPKLMTDQIALFTKEKWRNQIQAETGILRFFFPSEKIEFVEQEIANIKAGDVDREIAASHEIVENIIMKELFPQLNDLGDVQNIYVLKSYMLAMMVARLVEVNLGVVPPDDRDSWSNKRLETASRSMDQLMRAIWRRYINDIKKQMEKKDIDHKPDIERLVGTTNITRFFESSFTGQNWGVPGSMKVNMTQVPAHESVVALYSHMTRIDVATNRNDKQPSIRMIHPTQYGFVCVTGDTQVSIDQNHTRPIRELEDGDQVLTVSKNDLMETPSKIQHCFETTPTTLLQITTISGRTIKCTPDHPFLVRKSSEKPHQWVKAGNLVSSDCVVVKNTPESEYADYQAFSMNHLLGYEPFVSMVKDTDDKLAIPIHAIQEVPVEKVYDFETVHSNHSFIANGFVTHNCPVESPEGENCTVLRTAVETPLGPRKIGNLKDGDEVYTVNPISHQREVTQIYKHFTKPAEIFEVKTLGEWSIEVTEDHPFLAVDNVWKQTSELNAGDRVYVQYRVHSRKHGTETPKTILKYIQVPLLSFKLRRKANKELRELGILPLDNNSKYLPVLARMVGFSFGDAHISQGKTGSGGWSGYFGLPCDAKEFERDVKYLGFEPKVAKKVTSTQKMPDGRNVTQTVYTVHRGGTFCYLLMALGVPIGNKNRNPYDVPNWVLYGSPLVQREFLAGFQGADGGSPWWRPRKGKKRAYEWMFGVTRKHKVKAHLTNLLAFFEDMKLLYDDLKVQTHKIRMKRAYDDMYNVELPFSKSLESIINYAENVGYRYCQTKRARLEKLYFYFRYKRQLWNDRIALKQEIVERHGKGEKPLALAREKGLTTRQIGSFLEQADKETLPPRNILNPDEFLREYYDGEGCFLPIVSIEPKGEELVCDFTTVSDHHSFIGNGFVTHNCGIVKNLAVTAQITHSKSDAGVQREILTATSSKGAPLFSVEPTRVHQTTVLVNGKFLGWCDGPSMRRYLIHLRRTATIHLDTGITLDTRDNLYVHTDTSRLVRPLLVVEPVERQGKVHYEPLIKTKKLLGASIRKLFEEGVVEYVDSYEVESEDFLVATTFDQISEKQDSEVEDTALLQEAKRKKKRVQRALRKDPESVKLRLQAEQLDFKIKNLENTLTKLKAGKHFTHVEMDPTSILGIAASIIPYPNHNQGPRNTYQCLKDDTKILMADGSEKEIRDITVGERVWSFDPKTMHYETTKVVHRLVQPTTKKIYKVETVSGRTITATFDHKFYTSEGWKAVQDFESGKTLLGISLHPVAIRFVPIKQVVEMENCLIADITTESENHSFIANNFCVHNSSMFKQALGIMRAHHMACYSGKHKVLAYPTRPLFEPQLNETLNLNAYPQGEMVWVAFATTTGFTQEDAIVFNRASIDRGKFRMFKYINHRVTFKSDGNRVEKLKLPTSITAEQRTQVYPHINVNGLPTIGAHIKQRQAIIGKVVMMGEEEVVNESILLGYGEEGTVDRVIVTHNGTAETIVYVRLRVVRIPIAGDKFAPRNAQKVTIGKILPPEDMPFTEEGWIPDIIVNPHAMPSRMTHSYMMELIASKAGAIVGERINATAFRKFEYEKFKGILRDYGYSDDGKHYMYSGPSGRLMQARIYSGPCYFQALRHHVRDKIQARRTGPRSATSRQPVKGRALMGGLRFGEMERDAAIVHGAAYFLKERLCGVSDCYKTVACRCGQIATKAMDGGYTCQLCGDAASFGRFETTYAIALLSKMLAGLGLKQVFSFETEEQQRKRMERGGHLPPPRKKSPIQFPEDAPDYFIREMEEEEEEDEFEL